MRHLAEVLSRRFDRADLGGLQLLRLEARRHAGKLVRVALALLGEGRLLLLVPDEGGLHHWVHHACAIHMPVPMPMHMTMRTCRVDRPCTCSALLHRAPRAQAIPLRRHLSVPLRLLLRLGPLHPSERLELLRLAPLVV